MSIENLDQGATRKLAEEMKNADDGRTDMSRPLRMLWSAVILRAVCDAVVFPYQHPTGHSARVWLASARREVGWPLWICDHLGVDREKILEWVNSSPPKESVTEALKAGRSRVVKHRPTKKEARK